MCGRFSLATPPEVLARQFGLHEAPALPPRYNVAPTQPVAVVRAGDGPKQRELVTMRWGLVPFWAKDRAIGNRLINARFETADKKPAFRDAFRKRRCVIPADGFFEWRADPGGKQPFWIHSPGGTPLAMAGLWDSWRDPSGGLLTSCTILTRPADAFVARFHDRMPVLLSAAEYGPWLEVGAVDRGHLRALLEAAKPPVLEAVPVSKRVNRPANDDPSVLDAVGPPLEPC